MPVIAPEKTWEIHANNTVGQASEQLTNRSQIWEMKESLVDGGTFTTPCIVRGSSNSVAGDMDAVDRWVTSANVIGNHTLNVAHSWIVLEFPGIQFAGTANPLQVLISMNGGISGGVPEAYRSFVISPREGFTGGSATQDPTATDQWAPFWRGQFFTGVGNMPALIQTVSIASDGSTARVLIGSGASIEKRWLSFETPKDPVDGWDTPFFFITTNNNTRFHRVIDWDAVQSQSPKIIHKHTSRVAGDLDGAGYAREGKCALMSLSAANVHTTNDPTFNFLHDITFDLLLSPAWVFSESQGHEGVWGQLQDFHFFSEVNNISGDSIPATGERTWWVLNGLVFPGLNDSATDLVL